MTPLELRADGGGSRLEVSGEIDLTNVDRLRAALDGAIGGQPLVVDLSAVSYIDSSGIAVLFETAARRTLELLCPASSAVRRIVELTHLAEVAVLKEE